MLWFYQLQDSAVSLKDALCIQQTILGHLLGITEQGVDDRLWDGNQLI
jgi:hypothetical protein